MHAVQLGVREQRYLSEKLEGKCIPHDAHVLIPSMYPALHILCCVRSVMPGLEPDLCSLGVATTLAI